MEQWIGSVHSKMAWRTHFFLFGVYRVLEKSSSYIYIYIYLFILFFYRKLTVSIILRILSRGLEKKCAFHWLQKAYIKYSYTPAETTSLTNNVSNKTRPITQITSIDEPPTT